MPSYKTNDPKGWGGNPSRGAALGRPTIAEAPRDESIKIHLRRVHLDSGGYDKNGTYFGNRIPLYWAADKEGNVDFIVVGATREAAKEQVREYYPKAKFFR